MGTSFRMGRIMLLLISTALAAPQGNNSDSSGYLDYSGIIYERSAISNSLVEDRAINTCGCAPVSSTDRIVGGKEVNPKGKLPYQVMFFPCAPSGQCGLCGGTIVNKKFVITAAHCWDSRMTNLRVIVGEHNVFCDGVNEGGKVINVKKATMHPDYNKKTTDNDIAVLERSEGLQRDGFNHLGLGRNNWLRPKRPAAKAADTMWLEGVDGEDPWSKGREMHQSVAHTQ